MKQQAERSTCKIAHFEGGLLYYMHNPGSNWVSIELKEASLLCYLPLCLSVSI